MASVRGCPVPDDRLYEPEQLLWYRRRDDGLRSVDGALVPQLGAALVHLDLTPYQLHRLDEGLLGVTNELKAYEMARRRSAVPGFTHEEVLVYTRLAADAVAESSMIVSLPSSI